MRVVVIGGTGHVGTYLVPRLVAAGYEVIVVSRGQRTPYHPHAAWKAVKPVQLDRENEDRQGTFGRKIADMGPDIVIDMICFTTESANQIVDALRGQVQHFLHCGTIWIHGPSVEVPTTEEQPRRPISDYGRKKAQIEAYLQHEARQNGFPATCLHPGHIVGPGWIPLNPLGNFNPEVYGQLARGEKVVLPNLGMETVHHVHADDVAQAFLKAMANRSTALGESFHVVSPAAVTLRGYAEAVAGWFGQSPQLSFAPWDRWRGSVPPEDAETTWDHIARSPNCSIAKARRLLDYQPRYSSLQALYAAVMWLIENGQIDVYGDSA